MEAQQDKPPAPETTALPQILKDVEARLAAFDASPFSAGAFDLLKEKINIYVVQVIDESLKIMRRRKLDTVSAAHVEQASDYLISDTGRRFFRHLGTIGGILLGAALSNLLRMTTAEQFSTTGVVVTSAIAIVGTFLVAFHIARD